MVPGSVELARRVVVRVLVERVLPGLARGRGLVVLLQVLVQVARRVMAGRRARQAYPIRTQVLLERRAVGQVRLRELLERRVPALVPVPGGLPVQELDEHLRRE
ncbi:MAG: hypothetical protein JNN26_26180 [Candidatus Obscuribacter sp.]|nr:hypothetical protein [Candidatus Obscuribacter sp.]